jgi:anaerobic C4-dicarboxylate transporter
MLQNITVEVPNGTTAFYNPPEICIPTQWLDIVVFLLTNYGAHIGTIRIDAGSRGSYKLGKYVLCFFFPLVGLQLALACIFDTAMFARSSIEKAARSGALLRIVPKDKYSKEQLIVALVEH